MKVILIFKKDSPFKGKTERFNDVDEVHYRYPRFDNRANRVAIELDNTGYTYDLDYIEEMEIR